jgi:TolA-binding protein
MNTVESTCPKRDIITFQFQPNHHFDTIKQEIVKRCKKNAPKLTLTTKKLPEKNLAEKSLPEKALSINLPLGYLPSPPIDEKPRLSSAEISERIKTLQDEKHKLFQMLKHLVDQEKLKKQQKQRQQELLEQEEQRSTKRRKKTRWSPLEHPVYSYQLPSCYYHPSKVSTRAFS